MVSGQTVDFFNRVYFWSRVDRGKRRFSNTMTSNVVDRQKRFEDASCGRGFVEKGKKSPFQKYPDTCGQAKTRP